MTMPQMPSPPWPVAKEDAPTPQQQAKTLDRLAAMREAMQGASTDPAIMARLAAALEHMPEPIDMNTPIKSLYPLDPPGTTFTLAEILAESEEEDLDVPEDPPEDPIVAAVCDDLQARSAAGLRKYGVPLSRKDLDLGQWLRHAYEEILDLACYMRRAMAEVDAVTASRRAPTDDGA